MDDKERKIRDRLRQIASEHGPAQVFDGVVNGVDSVGYFADVLLDDGRQLFDVRLRAQFLQNQSIDVLPKMGSAIVVLMVTDDDYIMLAADEISSYRVSVGEMILEVDEDGFTIGNGTETLGKILTDLTSATLSIAAPKDAATLTALNSTRIKSILK